MTLMKPKNDITLIWDEVPGDDIDRYEIYRSPYLPILHALGVGTNSFLINCIVKDWYKIGDVIEVTGSSVGNDGNYTIVNVTEGSAYTTITVSETIPSLAYNDGYLGNPQINQLAGSTKSHFYTDKDMPNGYYYYVIYAIDIAGNYLNPSDIAIKYSEAY